MPQLIRKMPCNLPEQGDVIVYPGSVLLHVGAQHVQSV